MPAATAASTALRTSGRSIVISSAVSRRSVCTALEVVAVSASIPRLCRKQRQLGLARAAQHLDVDLDAVDAARGGEGARLGLDPLGDEHAAAGGERRVQADALQVAGELLDGLP